MQLQHYHSEGGAADENKIPSGSFQASSHSGTRAASRLSEASGVSVHSRTTYQVPFVIGGSTGFCSIVPMGNYFNDTVALVVWSWLARLFALRISFETKDCANIVSITRLPQLSFWCSLVQQSIFVSRTRMGNTPTNTRTSNPSIWET